MASKGAPDWAAGAGGGGGWDAEQQPQRVQYSSGWDAAYSQPQPQQQQYGDQSHGGSGWEQQGGGGGGGESGGSQQAQDAQYAQQSWPETSRVRRGAEAEIRRAVFHSDLLPVHPFHWSCRLA